MDKSEILLIVFLLVCAGGYFAYRIISDNEKHKSEINIGQQLPWIYRDALTEQKEAEKQAEERKETEERREAEEKARKAQLLNLQIQEFERNRQEAIRRLEIQQMEINMRWQQEMMNMHLQQQSDAWNYSITPISSPSCTSSYTPSYTPSYKRTCSIHGVEYDIHGSCPLCSRPQFGFDNYVECPIHHYSYDPKNGCPACK